MNWRLRPRSLCSLSLPGRGGEGVGKGEGVEFMSMRRVAVDWRDEEDGGGGRSVDVHRVVVSVAPPAPPLYAPPSPPPPAPPPRSVLLQLSACSAVGRL